MIQFRYGRRKNAGAHFYIMYKTAPRTAAVRMSTMGDAERLKHFFK